VKPSYNYNYLLDMGDEETAKFTVSILAEEVVFSIFEFEDWGNKRGFLIGLDEINNGRKYVYLKFCSTIFDSWALDICDNPVSKVKKWIFFLIKIIYFGDPGNGCIAKR